MHAHQTPRYVRLWALLSTVLLCLVAVQWASCLRRPIHITPIRVNRPTPSSTTTTTKAAADEEAPPTTPCPTLPAPVLSTKAAVATRDPTQYRLTIKVFTYNRLSGLKRLLKSLVESDYMGHTVTLNMFLDYPKKAPTDPDRSGDLPDEGTRSFLDGFVWPHGEWTLHRRIANAGLKRTIVEAWYPTSDDEVAAFFEDDIEVAPQWYRWTMAALKEYAPPPAPGRKGDLATVQIEKVLGISLFRPIHDELSGRGCVVSNDNKPFLLQQPCSWGAVYLPRPWRRFRRFYDRVNRLSEPIEVRLDDGEEPTSNTWATSSSWKKYLIRLMADNGWTMVYPNAPSKLVFATNHLMKGEHPTPNRKLFELPLVPSDATTELDHHVRDLPSFSDLWVFDVLFRRLKGVTDVPHFSAPLPA